MTHENALLKSKLEAAERERDDLRQRVYMLETITPTEQPLYERIASLEQENERLRGLVEPDLWDWDIRDKQQKAEIESLRALLQSIQHACHAGINGHNWSITISDADSGQERGEVFVSKTEATEIFENIRKP